MNWSFLEFIRSHFRIDTLLAVLAILFATVQCFDSRRSKKRYAGHRTVDVYSFYRPVSTTACPRLLTSSKKLILRWK